MHSKINSKNTRKSIIRPGIPASIFPFFAFLIPVLFSMLVLIGKGVYPFGDNCILNSDLYQQYCPFFYDFKDIMQNRRSLSYNWNLGLGGDFLSSYAYYLSSPINLLLYFCPASHIIEFITYSIVFRMGLAGLSFFIFLRYRFNLSSKFSFAGQTKLINLSSSKNQPQMSDQSEDFVTLIAGLTLSTAYAMSGYVAAYNWHVMWMDAIWLTPITLLGLHKLYREEKGFIYYLSLSLAIISNYYIAMMICIFLVLYALILLVSEPDKKFKKVRFCISFSIYSLLAGGTASFLLFPTILGLSSGTSQIESFPQHILWYFNALEEFARGLAFAQPYAMGKFWPNIYTGVFTLILVLLYVTIPSISKKTKALHIGLLIFFSLSFMNNVLSYLWHGLRFPTWFPARQSFLYIFLMLQLAMETIIHREEIKKKHLLLSGLILIGTICLAAPFTDKDITQEYAFFISVVLILLYVLLYFAYLYVDKNLKSFVLRLLLVLALGELFFNFKNTSFGVISRSDYISQIESYKQLLSTISEDDFYRVGEENAFLRNDGSLMNFKSASSFSTFINARLFSFYSRNRMPSTTRDYMYDNATPLSSALLSVHYTLSKNPLFTSDNRTLIASNEGGYLYQNKYQLPLGFVLDDDTEALLNISTFDLSGSNILTNKLTNQKIFEPVNKLIEQEVSEPTNKPMEQEVSGPTNNLIEQEAFDLINLPQDTEKYTNAEYIFDNSGHYYLELHSSYFTADTIEELPSVIMSFDKKQEALTIDLAPYRLIDLGSIQKGDTLHIQLPEDYSCSVNIYQNSDAVWDQIFEKLSAANLLITDFQDTKITGTVELTSPGSLVFSIPLDRGWSLYVDGEEADISSFCQTFIKTRLEEGQHKIVLEYHTPYLTQGLLVSLFCILLASVLLFFQNCPGKSIHSKHHTHH